MKTIRRTILRIFAAALSFMMLAPVAAQQVLFDFDNAPLHSSLPIDQTAGGITAHLSATPPGYSIQDNSAPVVPQGFTGRFIYPNSINLSDLIIKFDQSLSAFAIKYSVQELACDTSATMRVTAFMNGNLVGTNTMVARVPGTWPVDTLRCSFQQGFDSVVVHYDKNAPGCQDYGVIFIADDMVVMPLNTSSVASPDRVVDRLVINNPIAKIAVISFSLSQSENLSIAIYDISGRQIKNLFTGALNGGEHQLTWDVKEDAINAGVYFLTMASGNFCRSHKLVVVK